jgi:pilus assembly protein CpaB
MSKKRIVVIALAAGSAVMAAVLAKGIISKKQPEVETTVIDKVEKIEVLVTAKDLQIGDRLSTGAVLWKNWPKESVIESMITKDEMPDAEATLMQYRAKYTMLEGETVNMRKLVDPKGSGMLSAILSKGMRAMSVRVNDRASAGGFILPNDRVDVVVSKKLISADGRKLFKTETVIENVRVLAINQIYKQAAPVSAEGGGEAEGENAIKGESATLEMTLQQAEVLLRAQDEGEDDLSLVLRSMAENEGISNPSAQLTEKYRGVDGNSKKSSDTLYIRAGQESFASGN